ncbi:hypothetical protein KUCAC02_021281 [Chaenocephalus aceratus]|uniref:Uncharacterized protein n=1 Tax=Chaenocephalus aceratus TaxID=36190 RepID=A0ACB9XF04_CHAAC|nr:hypothetical protein KUCAC02_021281 [Chaenocephalus aceratus]
MKSPERMHHCAANEPGALQSYNLKLQILAALERSATRELGLTSPAVTTSQSLQRRTVRYGAPLGSPSEMTLALLPAYWFKQAAPTDPGEKDQPGAQWTNAPEFNSCCGNEEFEKCLRNLSA